LRTSLKLSGVRRSASATADIRGAVKEGEVSTPTTRIDENEFFRETSDPALQESADRGETKLLSYRELYELWERQQWRTQDIDFTKDREHWWGFPEEERYQRMYGLSSFFIGEQRVTDELGPMIKAAPTEEMKVFLSTQVADEARHVRFFDRFYSEVGVLESNSLHARLEETSEHLNPAFHTLFDEMLGSRTQRLGEAPDDQEALVEAVTLYHMVIEGMLALTGQHFIIDYNEREGTLPGFVQGFNLIARDEHRHVAFGARFLREKANEEERFRKAITGAMEEALPIADAVLAPPWAEDVDTFEIFGVSMDDTRAYAIQALTRRLKVIGLAPAI
jgi:ribonucleoside-diphosphate reductase beta chain